MYILNRIEHTYDTIQGDIYVHTKTHPSLSLKTTTTDRFPRQRERGWPNLHVEKRHSACKAKNVYSILDDYVSLIDRISAVFATAVILLFFLFAVFIAPTYFHSLTRR